MMIDRLFKKSSRNKPDPKVGIALGGGGAKGLSHILMLEALDELGVRPHMVSGCSIGAIAGLLYTSGMSGARMREEISRLVFSEKESITETLMKKDILKWITMATPTSQGGGLLKVDKFMSYLLDIVKVT
ncbi:patatin-like phospholipase family protein, partial [bacterium]|nr:patatin-like phospholipase family protein [bacterium]